MGTEKKQRNAVIAERVKNGETQKAVATDYGITGERVRQIVYMVRRMRRKAEASKGDR